MRIMNQLKNLTIVFAVLGIILILVLVRNSNQNLFKQDVQTAIEATQDNKNLISPDQLKKSGKPFLVINLGSEDMPDFLHFENSIHLPLENLLDQTNRKILEEANGDIIIYSTDVSTAAKAWVILNQLRFKRVFILNSDINSEDLKYKFQPDTSARLEQDSN